MTTKQLVGVRVNKDGGAPDHLRAFRDRMADAGIRVNLPHNKAAHTPPDPVKISGQPLSELIVEGRRSKP